MSEIIKEVKVEEVKVEEVKVITPNDLGEEMKLDPKLIRRLLRKRFDKTGRTWGWKENDPELEKVKRYLLKQIVILEEEKEKKKIEREKAKEERQRAKAEALLAAQEQTATNED